ACGSTPPPAWSPWYCVGAGCQNACAGFGGLCSIRYCTNPPNSNQFQLTCGCEPTYPTLPPSLNPGFPTSPPSPTPIPGPWAKRKNVSFYSNAT
ncbi:MAG: hypothetical protein N2049_00005, partial [Anaerolineales bacterium]|nr:hypothetical protein [Anaerolineales bacterium]